MVVKHAYEDLGNANHGWLNAHYHFSFSGYYDPDKLSHGELLVINDDIIAPQTGFPTHGHNNMEIITYVRRGAISHQDSQGNKGRTSAGNVQVMSAGSGIRHSEHNLENEETNLYQIWIAPNQQGVEPRWDLAEFPKEPVTDQLILLVSGDKQAPLWIHQDARIYAGNLNAGTELTHNIKGKAYVLISEGEMRVDDIECKRGDGFAISDQASVVLSAKTDCEVLVIEVPGLREAR